MTRNIFSTTTGSRRTIACSSVDAPPFFPKPKTLCGKSAEISAPRMIGVYPQLRDAKVQYVWGGTLDFAFDVDAACGRCRRSALRSRLRWAWRCCRHLDGRETWPESSAVKNRPFPLQKSPFPCHPSACGAAIPGRFHWLALTTKCWTGSPRFTAACSSQEFSTAERQIRERAQRQRRWPPLQRKAIAAEQRHEH